MAESESERPTESAVVGSRFEPDIRLSEYESTEYRRLSDTALSSLRTEVNRDGVERLAYSFDQAGAVSLTATQYVGAVSLPDGPNIEIRPKAAGTHLLSLLRYAQDVSATTIERSVSLQTGATFIDAIGYLFATELNAILNRGLHREYQRVERTEERLRGRLNVQRQLQREPSPALDFECEYDELTTDTVVNRAILYATTVLLRLVREPDLRRSLQRSQYILRRQVTLTQVTASELQRVELTRLNDHLIMTLLRKAEIRVLTNEPIHVFVQFCCVFVPSPCIVADDNSEGILTERTGEHFESRVVV